MHVGTLKNSFTEKQTFLMTFLHVDFLLNGILRAESFLETIFFLREPNV